MGQGRVLWPGLSGGEKQGGSRGLGSGDFLVGITTLNVTVLRTTSGQLKFATRVHWPGSE
jgi:hypothetical protein